MEGMGLKIDVVCQLHQAAGGKTSNSIVERKTGIDKGYGKSLVLTYKPIFEVLGNLGVLGV